MKTGDERPAHALFALAEGQGGYFTAAQAKEAGFQEKTHTYHVRTGDWIREERGIYRLARFPLQPEGQKILWSLWSRNLKGEVQGVYSHQTALTVHDLTDLMPAKLHMTVPKGFRRRAPTPRVLVLHRGEVPASDRESRYGFAVTKPLRTLLDLLEAGSLLREMLLEAGREGLKRGIILRRELERHPVSDEVQRFLRDLGKR